MRYMRCLFPVIVLVLCMFCSCCSVPDVPSAAPTVTESTTTPETAVLPEPDYNRLVAPDSADARTAVLAEDTLTLAAQLPDAQWNQLPPWNGVTVPNLHQYDWNAYEQPQKFFREDLENIADLGFNFVRVPLDTRLFFDPEDPSAVHLERLVNLDEVISWSAELGIHVCIDVHYTFGFTTDGDNSNDTMWENPQEQELFLTFWDMLAERYRDIPNNLLSFNLLNEPNWGIGEEQYVDLMRRAMSRIRAYTPERLIFVDMLNTASEPVYALAEDRVAQSFHFYEPNALTHTGIHDDFGSAYPVIFGKGMITRGAGDFVLEGSFPAGTEIRLIVDEIHLSGVLHLTADGSEVFSHTYAMDPVGENGCIYIEEVGTGGEYRGYRNTFRVVLPEDACELRLFTTGDSHWFNLSRLYVNTGEHRYLFEQNLRSLPEGTDLNRIPNPHIRIAQDGTITDPDNALFHLVDAAYLQERFAAYKAFSDETGVAVMLQEFGVYYPAPYDLTLIYLGDLLDAANANGINWCGWDYFGAFSFYAVNDYEMREGADYTPFSNGWIAKDMLEVYQSHLTQ